MNLLKRLVRLPLVASPVVRVAGWVTITAIDLITRTPAPLPAADPVVRFEILGIANKLIQTFLSSKDGQVTLLNWCSQAAVGLVKSVFSALTGSNTNNQITANNIPNIMAGKIAGNHLVNGLTSEVFVIALSPNMINILGFLFLTVKTFILAVGVYQGYKYLFNTFKDNFLSLPEDADVIDVPGRPVYSYNPPNRKQLKKRFRD